MSAVTNSSTVELTAFDSKMIEKGLKELCEEAKKGLGKTDYVAKIVFDVRVKSSLSPQVDAACNIRDSQEVVFGADSKKGSQTIQEAACQIGLIIIKKEMTERLQRRSLSMTLTASLYDANNTLLKERVWKYERA